MASSLILVLVATTISAICVESQIAESHSSAQSLGTTRERRFWNWDRNRKQVNFTCPAIYGRYPHPNSCEYFYECRFAYPTLMHCNRGYLYDEAREQCRDQRRVKCRIVDGKKEVTDDEVRDVTFKCPYIWGTFAHPTDCSKYYVCLYNVPNLYQCYSGDLFHDKARRCLPKQRVNCGKRLDRDQMRTSRRPVIQPTTTVKPIFTTNPWRPITPEEIPTTTEVSGRNFNCPFLYGRYADPEDCSRYYECRFSIPYLNQCPESTLYDERKEECRKKEQVRCDARPGGTGDDNVEEQKKEKFRCPYIWGTFPHPDDCSKYIICVYDVPTLFTCRKNELFHARFRRCMPKDKVSCDYRINPDDLYPPGKTTIPATTSTTTKLPLLSTTLREIVVTTTTESTTTTTTEPTTTTTAKSTTTTTTEPTTTTTTEPTTTSTIESTTITTIQPTTTTTKPTTTTTIATQQPTTTTSPVTQVPTKVPSKKPNTPPPTDCKEDDLDCIIDTTGDVKGWFECPQQFGHFPHGSSRQLFIHCDRWRPFVKKCADGTIFSPVNLVCMWDFQIIP